VKKIESTSIEKFFAFGDAYRQHASRGSGAGEQCCCAGEACWTHREFSFGYRPSGAHGRQFSDASGGGLFQDISPGSRARRDLFSFPVRHFFDARCGVDV